MLAIIVMAMIMMLGCDKEVKKSEITVPELPKRVWIEFRDIQQGLDAFAKMKGHEAGLKVCVQGTYEYASYWLPPGAYISGGCEPIPFESQGFWWTKDNTLSHFFVDKEKGTITGGVMGSEEEWRKNLKESVK